MSYSDAPIPTNDVARFASWKSQVDETLARLVRTKTSRYVLTITGTTDASGLLTYSHDSQVVPKAIFCSVTTPTPSNVWPIITDSLTETTARTRFFTVSAGSVIAYAGSVTFWAQVII